MQILSVLQVISAIILIAVILLQQKGAGLGAAFGGSSNVYSTKRGLDKILHRATIVMSVFFFGISLLLVII